MNAMLLHEEVDQVFLLFTDIAEVMQELPHVHIEIILDKIHERAFSRLGDVVVRTWIVVLVVRDVHCHLVLLLTRRDDAMRQWYSGPGEQFALY